MNKFKVLSVESIITPAARDPKPVDLFLNKGIRLDISPQDMEPTGSPDLDLVRVEQGGLRADWAIGALGAGAPSTILAQGEHKFIQVTTGAVVQVTFRLVRNGLGFAEIYAYDSATDSWTLEATSDFTINNVLLSWLSYFDAVYFADGDRVFKWDRAELEEDAGDDFTAGNNLTKVGHNVSATITPAGATGNAYVVHYSLVIWGESSEDGKVVLEVVYEGVVVATETVDVPANTSNFNLTHGKIDVVHPIANNADLTLRIAEIDSTSQGIVNPLPAPGTDINTDKDPDREAIDLRYTFNFRLDDDAMGGSVTLEFYYDLGQGGGWVLGESVAGWTAGVDYTQDIVVSGMGPGAKFRMKFAVGTGVNWTIVTGAYVSWDDGFSVSVHGFNLATDADPSQGVTYNTTGDPQNVIRLVYKFGTTILVGRYLGFFADRIIVLQHEKDPQKLIHCARNRPDLWTGTGTNELILNSLSEGVDELNGFFALTANTAALYRNRSIMRAVQTGNVSLPIAFFSWIENLGTESPFGIVVIPGGNGFFGSDKQIYLLSEGSLPIPVGDPIHEELEGLIPDARLDEVEAVYDPVSSEYILIHPY